MNPSRVKLTLRILTILFATGLASPAGMAAGSHLLGNGKIKVSIADDGGLESVQNVLAAETYSFNADFFALATDLGEFSNRATKPHSVNADDRQVEFRYESGPGGAGVSLVYTLGPDNAFFRRWLKIRNPRALRLKNLTLGSTTFAQPARDVMHYVTFIAAPTVEFIRHAKGGLFTGIENPFFKADLSETGVALNFAPGLILKAGEGYTSEPQFMGVYRKSGVMVEDSGRAFRYNANGSGYKPIDRNEMRAMRAFALDYLNPAQKHFLNINYQFFHPQPQMPHTEREKDYCIHTIDTFSEIGGDTIIFKPLHRFSKPDDTKLFWDVVPDDTNTIARQVADHATRKGISYGFYLGCAAWGGQEGNPGGLTFRPDKPEWKKSDAAGHRAPDNCLACDDYYEWWFAVQNNTIQKYNLGNWSWDPSLGSGMNCHDESHGHIAGQGAYKGWRRCIELMGRMKAAKPGLFIQGFYGTKQFGLWGLKHVDQCEVYNEQTIIVSTRHNQISDDRQNADGLRFQNNWSMRFRFTPAIIGHALVHRISEGGFDPDLIKAWDYYGWQYSFLSSLAVAGSVMPTILPYETDLVPGYVGFYKKWLRWAKENFEYVNCTEPFGEQVQPGAVDGYARIKGNHGFVFLFNGNPRASEITFEVGDEINLQAKGDYQFTELYPSEKGKLVLDADGQSVFALGQKARIIVPANSCFVFELKRAAQTKLPVLIGAEGGVSQRGQALEITGVSGKPGQLLPLRVRLSNPGGIQSVTVNGVPQKFSALANEISADAQCAGERYLRELDSWTQADGQRFEFPNRVSLSGPKLATVFTVNRDVPQLLEKARPKNFAEMGGKIAQWQKSRGGEPSFGNSYSYHNFICERPERLWLVIPFLNPTDVEVTLNGQQVTTLMRDIPSSSAFLDVTELVNYGAENRLELSLGRLNPNAFIGPFLLYPDEAATSSILPESQQAGRPVIFSQSLVSPLPPRYRKGEGAKVVEAKMLGNVTLKTGAELCVKLDCPPDKIRQVMYFESGFPWMGQHPLQYNQARQCWTAMVTPGNRASIQENQDIYVWAEGNDGLRGEYYPVRVGWDFEKPAQPKVAGQLGDKTLVARVSPANLTVEGDTTHRLREISGDALETTAIIQPEERAHRREVAALAAAIGLAAHLVSASNSSPSGFWFEAENYEAQRGSTAPKFTMSSASGGACVDNGWGGQEGHFLRYKLNIASNVPVLCVTLRYAREMPGDAVVSVTLDGDTNTTRLVQLPSTADWGFKPEGWQYAPVQLPATARGAHTLEIRSLAERNNVNFDGFYLSAEPLDAARAVAEPPSGPEAIAPLGEGLSPLPCKTPVALPYSRRKAYVAGSGLVQSLLSTPEPRGMGGNVAGPGLHVKLAGHGPWQRVEQTLFNSPLPTVVTRLHWPEVEVVQEVFAAAPEAEGFFMRVTLTNKTNAAREFELASLVRHAEPAQIVDGPRLVANDQPLLRAFPAPGVVVSAGPSALPGPLGNAASLRHTLKVAGGSSIGFDLQFLGDGLSREEAYAGSAKVWREKLDSAAPVQLPDPKLQYAFDASLRQMLMLIETRPDHARVLKGLEHYYGANPYDTFQVSRALDAVGLKADAEELLRHQLTHLKDDGFFEMWETGDLKKPGADQWIVQGLAATALWNHYESWRDEAWLRDIAPALIKAARATLHLRQSHAGVRKQGTVAVEGWLPPIGGDGGLGLGYHWSQNAGALNGVRIAAEVARKLNRPETAELQAGYLDFQRAFDQARTRATQEDPDRMLPSFPGATGDQRSRPLWGVVMSVSAFGAIPPDDPGALGTLRFLRTNLYGGLHLNLGYSRGVWPYLSAEVALWHLRLGETDEAWRILRAMVDRASSTVCWYEEIDHQPPRGHGDSADVWAAAEMVYLARQLQLTQEANPTKKD